MRVLGCVGALDAEACAATVCVGAVAAGALVEKFVAVVVLAGTSVLAAAAGVCGEELAWVAIAMTPPIATSAATTAPTTIDAITERFREVTARSADFVLAATDASLGVGGRGRSVELSSSTIARSPALLFRSSAIRSAASIDCVRSPIRSARCSRTLRSTSALVARRPSSAIALSNASRMSAADAYRSSGSFESARSLIFRTASGTLTASGSTRASVIKFFSTAISFGPSIGVRPVRSS